MCPARTAPFVRVLGVANLEIFNVFTFGVAPSIELLFWDLDGEPFSVTFVGDDGRLAGDRSKETADGVLKSVNFGGGSGNLTGERRIQSPRLGPCGEVFNDSLNGDAGGRRAGLAITDALRFWGAALFTVEEFEKSIFLAEVEAKTLPGGFIGLIISGFVGVLPLPASSSSERLSFPVATCVVFFGLRGDDFCSSSLGRPRVARAAVTAGFRTGFALRPVATSFCLPLTFTAAGIMFSLSGS